MGCESTSLRLKSHSVAYFSDLFDLDAHCVVILKSSGWLHYRSHSTGSSRKEHGELSQYHRPTEVPNQSWDIDNEVV